MARKVVLLQSPPGNNPKAKSLVMRSVDQQVSGAGGERKKKKRVGEVAGGTTAECAAVCCCFPCTLMNLLVLAVVKVPACICRKVQERQRLAKKRKQKALLDPPSNCGSREEEFDLEIKRRSQMANPSTIKEEEEGNNINNGHENNNSNNNEGGAGDLDNEMWDRFYGTGFWRSPSQKGT